MANNSLHPHDYDKAAHEAANTKQDLIFSNLVAIEAANQLAALNYDKKYTTRH